MPTLQPARDASDPVRALAWSARPVLVFAPKADDPRLSDQLAWFHDERIAMDDRRMSVVQVIGDAVVSATGRVLADGTSIVLRERYGVDDGEFAVILIGLDGEVKRRAGRPLNPDSLFDQVDRMPLRRAVMGRGRL